MQTENAQANFIAKKQINDPKIHAFDTFLDTLEKEQRDGSVVGQTIERAPREKPSEEDEHSNVSEVPLQAIAGVRDAIQAGLEGLDNLADYINEHIVDLGALQITDKQGRFAPELISGKEKIRRALGTIQLPEIDRPTTTAGSLTRGITQFVTGFVPAMRATKVASAVGAASKIRRTVAAAAIADFSVFDPHEERLSNLVQDYPALRNPVTEFLAADPRDGALEGRVKNVLEGLGVEALVGGAFIGALKTVRAAKHIKKTDSKDVLDVMKKEALLASDDPALATLKSTKATEILGDKTLPLIRAANKEPVAAEIGEASPQLLDTKIDVGDMAFNINLARLNSTQDVDRLISAVAENTKEVLDEAVRGVQSNQETQRLAELIGMTPEDLLARRKGKAFNAEEALAARNILVSSAENLVDLAKKSRGIDATDADRIRLRRAISVHTAIQQQVSGLTAEAGRALQAFTIQAKGQKEQLKQINDLLVGNGGRGTTDAIAESLIALSDAGKDAATISRASVKLHQATTFDMVFETWINALLSGPMTHFVNVTSNTITAIAQIPERALASGIGMVTRSKNGVEAGEATALAYGVIQGMRDGWQLARHAFNTEGAADPLTKIEARTNRAVTAENLANSFIGRHMVDPALEVLGEKTLEKGGMAARFVDGLGAVIRFPGTRMLATEDAFFKGLNYRMELHAQAYRQAVSEGVNNADMAQRIQEIIADPPEHIRITALEKAQENTFTNPNRFAQNMRGAVNEVKPLKFVIPFLNTPSNLVKFAFERTPLAPLGSQFREDFLAGGARRDLALAKISMGSAAMVTAMQLAGEGRITGGAPADPDLRKIWLQENQPYSLRVGDRFVSYNRFDPFGMIIGFAADMQMIAERSDQATLDELASASVLAISRNVMSKTWMRGFAEFVDALENKQGELPRYVRNIASSFVPNLLRQTNVKLVDPVWREADNLMQAAQAKVPGLSDTLPARRDIWGQPMLSSSFPKAKNDPVNLLLLEHNIAVGMPHRVLSLNGQRARLTGEEYSRLVALARVPAKEALDELMVQGKLDNLTTQELEDVVASVLRAHAKRGRALLFKEFPNIIERMQ